MCCPITGKESVVATTHAVRWFIPVGDLLNVKIIEIAKRLFKISLKNPEIRKVELKRR